MNSKVFKPQKTDKRMLNKGVILSIFLIITLTTFTTAFNFESEGVQIISPIDSDTGGIEVSIQDQTSPAVDLFFVKLNSIPTTLAVNTSIDDRTLTLTSITSCSVNDYFGVFHPDTELGDRATFGNIQSIVGNNITLDTPMDFAYVSGDNAGCFSRNLNQDGSSTPIIYSVQVGSGATQCIDITRVMYSMITDTAVSLSEFGDVPSLNNGIILRRVNGDIRNFWNVKNNGELANLCFDYDPSVASNPSQGQDGAKFRCTFAGQEKHGVAIRLCPGESLQTIIQDDLTGLQQFRMIAEGHYVTN